MTEQLLKCNICERIAHDLSFKGRECRFRNPNGYLCNGSLELYEETEAPDPHLICDLCERRADKMDMEGKTCDWLLDGRRHCTGILRIANE